ncbi:DUF4760 domain-containing protein [Acinetobacter cumulans]|uniref:DUF4760 domain-containing protein n=1 Tax=Acinetobacter cumulans TaxID=2136182 RepID=A0A498CU89_9GAMM|nr:DUF4760 domain-containing protein [Acinetobacter cumulans]RLL31765.1 DUF4760 domain-containing protein [Acinetobacter cumulans]
MANNLSPQILKSRLTFIFALSAFLMSLYLVSGNISEFFKLSDWKIPDWLIFAQLLVFFASAYIAYSTIHSSRATSRERATLDTILDDNKDDSLTHSKNIVLMFNEDPAAYYIKHKKVGERDLAHLFCVAHHNLTNDEAEIRAHYLKVLNRYEFYAIGINKGLFDEELFKRMYCSTMLKFWGVVNPSVSQLREFAKKDTLFRDFEALAVRWKANPLKSEDIK